jgi:hypothetical protein
MAVEGWGREKHQTVRLSNGGRIENRYGVPLVVTEFAAHLGGDDECPGVPRWAARFSCGCFVLDGGLVRCGAHTGLVNVTIELSCW